MDKMTKEVKMTKIDATDKIGIVICNYNKQDYIINCIQSVLDSTMKNLDIYVVDNASIDDSVKCIEEKYAGKVNLIKNQENKGGSGGFNTGLREALKHDYKYIMLMDNDIVASKTGIEELYHFMEEHPETGIVGSKVYFMDYPEQIWGFGGMIDWNEYKQKDQYKNCIDSSDIPDTFYCDYVAACSLMARADAIREVGLMPEDNFIYWDDMEWGYRFNQAGYKVAVCGKSKIWHKAGGRNAGNTFIHYYMWRNRIQFFMNVLSAEQKTDFVEKILTEMFRMIYSVHLKGEDNIVRTLMYAYDDAVHGVRGKTRDERILPRPKVENRVKLALQDAKSVIIKYNGDMEGIGNIVRNIRSFALDMKITIAVPDEAEMRANEHFTDHDVMLQCEELQNQFPKDTITTQYTPEGYDQHLIMCDHIFKMTKGMEQDNYIDSWCNIIFSEADFVYAKSFEQTKELFLLCKRGFIENTDE